MGVEFIRNRTKITKRKPYGILPKLARATVQSNKGALSSIYVLSIH